MIRRRKTAHIDVRVEPELVARIDAWRNQQRVPPTRSAAIVYMIEQFLAHDPPPAGAAADSFPGGDVCL